jgi:hypothetical protein
MQRILHGSCQSPAQPTSWRIIHCQLSSRAYSKYSQLSSIFGDCLLYPQPEDAPCGGNEETTQRESMKHFKAKWFGNMYKNSSVYDSFTTRITEYSKCIASFIIIISITPILLFLDVLQKQSCQRSDFSTMHSPCFISLHETLLQLNNITTKINHKEWRGVFGLR